MSDWLLGSKDLPFQYTHHAMLFGGFGMFLCAGLFNLWFETASVWFSWAMILCSPIYLFLWYRSRFHNQFKTMAVIYMLFLSVVIMPANWFANAGMEGQTLLLFITAALYAGIIFRDDVYIKRWFYIFLLILPILLLLLEPWFVDWVYPYPDKTSKRADMIFTYVAMFAVSVLMVNMFGTRFAIEKDRADAYAAELKKLSERDPLTNLYNRYAFSNRYLQVQTTAEAQAQPVCLAIVDLDLFKRVNDDYGHGAGDAALVVFANALSRDFNESLELISRHGGEEFVLLITLPLNEARIKLDKFRCDFKHLPENTYQISFSGGLVELTKQELLQKAVNRADKLLYQAKNQGRDRIVAQPLS